MIPQKDSFSLGDWKEYLRVLAEDNVTNPAKQKDFMEMSQRILDKQEAKHLHKLILDCIFGRN